MYVIKRNGEKADVEFDSITQRNLEITKELKLDIDCGKLSQKVIMSLKSGMTTSEIDDLSAEEAYYLSGRYPEYGKLASYIAIGNMQKNAPKTFLECMTRLYNYRDDTGKLNPLISKDAYDFTLKHIGVIEKAIDKSRDYLYDYFGFKTLQKSYLLPFNSKTTWETPQYMLMRVQIGLWCDIHVDLDKIELCNKVQEFLVEECKERAYIMDKTHSEVAKMTGDDWKKIGLSSDNIRKISEHIQCLITPLKGDISKVIQNYHIDSLHFATKASPTLFNSGTNYPQLASCFLLSIPDSLDDMYSFLGKIAKISARGGGIGLDLSRIRSKGARVSSTQAPASGILPFMRILDNECLQVSQGRRKGSFAVYLQPWHPEIMTFLQVRLPDAPEEIKCSNIFTALWSNELLMDEFENKPYSLFCPSKVDLVESPRKGISGEIFRCREEEALFEAGSRSRNL